MNSDLQNGSFEITKAELKKIKRRTMKKTQGTSSSRRIYMCIFGSYRKRRKKRNRKSVEEIRVENFPYVMRKNRHTNLRSSKNSNQINLENCTVACHNQIVKSHRQRGNFESSQRKVTHNIQWNSY
jgi:hypothetical protein